MGGDFGPSVVVPGALQGARETGAKVILVGIEEEIRKVLAELKAEDGEGELYEVVNATQTIEMTDKPSEVVRGKRDSSMHVACKLVRQGEADAHAQCVSSRGGDGVLAGESLGAAANDAVNDDQGNEHAQGLSQSGNECLQAQIDHGNEASDDDDEHGDTDLVRHDLADQGDDDVGQGQDHQNGDAHAQAVKERGGNGHGGAHAQHLHQNGVLGQEAFHKLLFQIHGISFISRKPHDNTETRMKNQFKTAFQQKRKSFVPGKAEWQPCGKAVDLLAIGVDDRVLRHGLQGDQHDQL